MNTMTVLHRVGAGFLALLLGAQLALAAPPAQKPLKTSELMPLLRWFSTINIQDLRGSKLLSRMVVAMQKKVAGSKIPAPRLEGHLTADVATVGTWLGRVAPDAGKRGLLLRHGLQQGLASMKEAGTSLHLPNQYMVPAAQEGYDKGGVGILVSDEADRQGRFIVFETLDGFPAQAAGLAPGDRLLKVAGHSVVGVSYRQLADLVRGNLGTTVRLTIERGGLTSSFDVQRVWLNPNPKNISHSILESGIGYVRLKYLGARMDIELQKALADFKAAGVQAMVVDLRNNEGLFEGGLDVTGSFVPRGTLLTTLVTRLKKEAYRTQGFQQPVDLPLVLLVNRYTSGAGILMAGALRDAGRATLVGEATVWRDQPREAKPLSDGSVVTVTSGYYVLPKGQVLRARTPSLAPEVVVEQDPLLALGGAGDEQLRKAVELARTALVK